MFLNRYIRWCHRNICRSCLQEPASCPTSAGGAPHWRLVPDLHGTSLQIWPEFFRFHLAAFQPKLCRQIRPCCDSAAMLPISPSSQFREGKGYVTRVTAYLHDGHLRPAGQLPSDLARSASSSLKRNHAQRKGSGVSDAHATTLKQHSSTTSSGKTGRSERIRTSDPVVPNDVRYQAALHSVTSGWLIDRHNRRHKPPHRQFPAREE